MILIGGSGNTEEETSENTSEGKENLKPQLALETKIKSHFLGGQKSYVRFRKIKVRMDSLDSQT